jgi:beta-glucosidase
MSAINAVQGVPMAANKELLLHTLKGDFGFQGFVVSDCDTLTPMVTDLHYAGDIAEASALSVLAGGDLNCGPGTLLAPVEPTDHYGTQPTPLARRVQLLDRGPGSWPHPRTGHRRGPHPLVGGQNMDRRSRSVPDCWKAQRDGGHDELRALVACLPADPPGFDPYAWISLSVVNSEAHKALARQLAREAVVLLHNRHKTLPLHGGLKKVRMGRGVQSFPRSDCLNLPSSWACCGARQVAVIGPSADEPRVQAHTYHGTPERWITVLDGLREDALGRLEVGYARGCDWHNGNTSGFPEAVALAAESDVVVFVGGLVASDEEEDTDRQSLALPSVQVTCGITPKGY